MFNERELRATINRTLDDTACALIRRGAIAGGGSRDWDQIMGCLKKWESEGILKIVRDPQFAESGDECVEMLSYIYRKSAIPGFLNWD